VFAVIQFPGSNDDRDMQRALEQALGARAALVWHKDASLPADTRAVLLPGGFSYGDYLRCGAMARFSPVMAAVRRFADAGGFVLGTCNGFQVLCEAGLLPGALLRNAGLDFVCDPELCVRVEQAAAPFTSRASVGQVLAIPVKHGEGRFSIEGDALARLEANGQIVLRYCDADGKVSDAANPNGSVANVAGVRNARGNVMGLMPHPEHAADPLAGRTDGLVILGSLLDALGSTR
jgi:phosphoribosylformylglycinamidine synthase